MLRPLSRKAFLSAALALSSCVVNTCPLTGQDPAKPATPAAASNGTRPASATYPLDAVVDSTGSVWIVDRNVPGVWKHTDGKTELAVQGSKKFRQALNAVRCIAVGANNELFVGDPATRDVYSITPGAAPKPLMSGIIGIPMDLAVAKDGTLFVADVERRVVWKKLPSSDKPEVFADCNPRGLFIDTNDKLWVISQNEEQLLRYSMTGEKEVIVGKRTFDFAHQIVVDAQGIAWVSDGYKKGLWRIEPNKAPELVISGEPLQNPVGLLLIDNRPVIVDPHAQSVFKLTADNKAELWFKIEKP